MGGKLTLARDPMRGKRGAAVRAGLSYPAVTTERHAQTHARTKIMQGPIFAVVVTSSCHEL